MAEAGVTGRSPRCRQGVQGRRWGQGRAPRALLSSWGSRRLAGWLRVGGVPYCHLLPGTSLLAGDCSMEVESVAVGEQAGR